MYDISQQNDSRKCKIDKWSKGNNCIIVNIRDRKQVVDNSHLCNICVSERRFQRQLVLIVHMNRLSSTQLHYMSNVIFSE